MEAIAGDFFELCLGFVFHVLYWIFRWGSGANLGEMEVSLYKGTMDRFEPVRTPGQLLMERVGGWWKVGSCW